MLDKIKETADFLFSKMSETPLFGLITGTGLSSLTEHVDIETRIPYAEIPNFPTSTTQGHAGSLVVGRLSDRQIIIMEGRFHLYEGYSPSEITFPIRVFSRLGVQNLLISSAAGGLNPQFETGDLMIVTDHINLSGVNPLVGPNLDAFGSRFPDMSVVYDHDLVRMARTKALECRISVRQGIYAGVLGPSLETPAETRYLKLIGADAVGMSTVQEAIVAVHCNMKIIAIVVITNMNLPDCMKKTSVEEVIATAQTSGKHLSLLWEKIIRAMPE